MINNQQMTSWHWSHLDFRAMNTNIYAKLYSSMTNSHEIVEDVKRLFCSMDRRLSRFNPESELSSFNQSSGSVVASPILYAVLEVALWAAQVTGGLFDPTILPDLEHAGYRQSFEYVAGSDTQNDDPPQARFGRFRTLTLSPAGYVVDKPDDVKVDLGGIGKGWTVDRAADRLQGLGSFLVNAGGDLYAYGAPPQEAGWQVVIPHPLAGNETIATLRVRDRAIATSSIVRRRWQRGRQRFHHLIDPRTARPAKTNIVSVTVISSRVALAEVLAKTALILGSQQGLNYLEAIPDVEGLLVTQDGAILQTSGFVQYFES